MKSIYDYTQEQLIDEFLELGEKKFRDLVQSYLK